MNTNQVVFSLSVFLQVVPCNDAVLLFEQLVRLTPLQKFLFDLAYDMRNLKINVYNSTEYLHGFYFDI